jgi:preprotein translocase subunit SecG
MDFSSNRTVRNSLIALAVAMASVVAWFLLTSLLRFAGRFAGSIALVLLMLTAVFLIVLILVQRGKGGGLAGAFGGLGGQSAFGTKAGDLFTRVTMGAALFWIILCMAAVSVLGTSQNIVSEDIGGGPRQNAPPTSSDNETGRSSPRAPAGDTGPSGSQDSGS